MSRDLGAGEQASSPLPLPTPGGPHHPVVNATTGLNKKKKNRNGRACGVCRRPAIDGVGAYPSPAWSADSPSPLMRPHPCAGTARVLGYQSAAARPRRRACRRTSASCTATRAGVAVLSHRLRSYYPPILSSYPPLILHAARVRRCGNSQPRKRFLGCRHIPTSESIVVGPSCSLNQRPLSPCDPRRCLCMYARTPPFDIHGSVRSLS